MVAKILFLKVETYMRHRKERTSGPMAFISNPAAHGTVGDDGGWCFWSRIYPGSPSHTNNPCSDDPDHLKFTILKEPTLS